MTRTQAADYYNTAYLASEGVASGWTGDVALGNAGTLSAGFLDAIRNRVNWYRTMAGLPGTVSFDPTLNAKSQQAALMMSANRSLSHSPPPSWRFYTAAGAEAAGHSNLALGRADADAIDLFIQDSGAGNTFVGHRRWILYPPQQTMGVGSIPSTDWGTAPPAMALWVLSGNGNPNPPSTPEVVTWPPPGYVPYEAVFQRWSMSYALGSASFATANVTMTRDGVNVPVNIISRTDNGYGNDTLVWEPDGAGWPFSQDAHGQPGQDVTYTVTVDHVSVGGVFKSFSYTTSVFDAAAPDVPGLSRFHFGATTTPVGESAGAAFIEVFRSGDVTGAATVSYVTADGSARAGTDYLSTTGILSFAPGERKQTILVPILDDQATEPAEGFLVSLAAPSGGTVLGFPSTLTVSIADDDASPTPFEAPPQLVSVRRGGSRAGLTSLVLTFSEPLDPAAASGLAGYQIRRAGRDRRFGTRDDAKLALKRAVYNPAARSITLLLSRPFRGAEKLQLALAARRVVGAGGMSLDGDRDGLPGGDCVVRV
jgi:uncharacterized protein YkwD